MRENVAMAIDPSEIELDETQRRQLAEMAEKTGRAWSELLADALESRLPAPSSADGDRDEESLFDALTRSGFVGCVPDGPPDLSTNPKYMEGFGENGGRESAD